MRVNGGSDSDSIKNRKDLQEQDAVRLHTKGTRPPADAVKGKNAGPQPQVDTVNLQLARAINAELNPDAIDHERSKRVAELKALVAAGQYNPSSDAVAEALGREIMLEILSGGGVNFGED